MAVFKIKSCNLVRFQQKNPMQAQIKKESNLKKWFDDLVSTIRKDQLLIETGTASKEVRTMYEFLSKADQDELHENIRTTNSHYFIKKLVLDYIHEVKLRGKNPEKLALQLSESRILVWAEIKDDDEETEDALLLAEAKINSKYNHVGFNISSTILEKSDNFKIPEQFSSAL
jgi:hypothetical protein